MACTAVCIKLAILEVVIRLSAHAHISPQIPEYGWYSGLHQTCNFGSRYPSKCACAHFTTNSEIWPVRRMSLVGLALTARLIRRP